MPPIKKTTTKKVSHKLAGKLTKKKPPKKKLRPEIEERPVVYREPKVELRQSSDNTQITEEDAKTLLGWSIVTNESPFDFKDLEDNKIKCHNNCKNRPFRLAKCRKILTQEILRRRFQLNMENLIIGRTGLVLNAQHRLVGLIFACQLWRKEDGEDYSEFWPEEPPYIESTIAFGASEEDSVVNTYDTGTPRTLADVLYRSEHFGDLSDNKRNKVAKVCDGCVKMLWHRTGASNTAFAVHRTHSESLDFIDRHERMLMCVRTIHDMEGQGKERKVSGFLSLGYSSALLYLMSCATSYQADYIRDDNRCEDTLDFSLWDVACDFWHALSTGAKEFGAVRRYLADLLSEHGKVPWRDRMCLLINAWRVFSQNKPITTDSVKLVYTEDDDGVRVLSEYPTVGGIDEGEPNELRPPDPTPDEIREAAGNIRKENTLKRSLGGSKKDATEEPDLKVGDKVWVDAGEGEESLWRGTIREIYDGLRGKNAKVEPDPGYAGAGGTYETYLRSCHSEKPKF